MNWARATSNHIVHGTAFIPTKQTMTEIKIRQHCTCQSWRKIYIYVMCEPVDIYRTIEDLNPPPSPPSQPAFAYL